MDQDELAARIARAGDEGWSTLNLSENGLKYLHAQIGNLTSLIRPALWGNQFTMLPSEVQKLVDKAVVLFTSPFTHQEIGLPSRQY